MVDALPILKSYLFGMLYYSIEMYMWLVFVYIIAGFFTNNRSAGWYVFMEELVEPAFAKIRLWTRNKLVIERFDLSPLLLFAAIKLAQWLLHQLFF